jgi:hypothetical protein
MILWQAFAWIERRESKMFEGFAEQKIGVGDVEISCVTAGSGPAVAAPSWFSAKQDDVGPRSAETG